MLLQGYRTGVRRNPMRGAVGNNIARTSVSHQKFFFFFFFISRFMPIRTALGQIGLYRPAETDRFKLIAALDQAYSDGLSALCSPSPLSHSLTP